MIPTPDISVESILEFDRNRAVFEEVVDLLRSPNGVTFFVGAGLSMASGFPGWTSFLLAEGNRVGLDL